MKIIIDVSRDFYERIQDDVYDPRYDAIDALKAVRNGVPLNVIEDIKTEIKELPYQRIFGHVSSYSLLDTVLEIIDKHCGGE